MPFWVWAVLGLGGVLGLLGLLLTAAPILFLVWGVGNGPQYDTRLIFGSDSLAVVHLDGDLSDPGLADLSVAIGDLMPALEEHRQRARGAPDELAQLAGMRRSMQFAGEQPIGLPRQVTLIVQRSPDDDDDAVLTSVNLLALGRMISAMFRFIPAVVPQDGANALEVVELEGHRIYARTRKGDPDDWFFFGMLDSTMLVGEGRADHAERAMGRLVAGTGDPGPLHGLIASMQPDGWDLWGGTLLDAAPLGRLDGLLGDGTPPLCLADLDKAAHPGVVFGVDVQSADVADIELLVPVAPSASRQPAKSCLRALCIQGQDAGAVWGLQLVCEVEEQSQGVAATVRVRGIERAMLEAASALDSPG